MQSIDLVYPVILGPTFCNIIFINPFHIKRSYPIVFLKIYRDNLIHRTVKYPYPSCPIQTYSDFPKFRYLNLLDCPRHKTPILHFNIRPIGRTTDISYLENLIFSGNIHYLPEDNTNSNLIIPVRR